jgi:hypothetical protein
MDLRIKMVGSLEILLRSETSSNQSAVNDRLMHGRFCEDDVQFPHTLRVVELERWSV